MRTKSRLKAARFKKGLPIVALCVKAGVGTGTIVAIEKHGHDPRPHTKQRIAKALGLGVRAIWPE